LKATPFRIDIPPAVIDDLRTRLHATRWSGTLDESDGYPLADLQRAVRYWADDYDWFAQQRVLNELPHFIADDVHFIHVRNERADATPLLLLHGWPGSFLEFLGALPRLARSFHLVIPSLPGYGFSAPRAMTNKAMATLFANLMRNLGYERFAAQGGDWGAGITTWMARLHPEHLLAIHLNYIPGSYAPHVDGPLDDDERAFFASRDRWVEESGAYGHVQRTRPLTLAHALADSPAGFAAWMLEKFREWAAPDSAITLDELFTNITLYWVTNTIHSSMRLYRESVATPLRLEPGERITVPTSIAHFPHEEPFPPRRWIERGYDIVRWRDMPHGGHFAALEQPDAFAADVEEALTYDKLSACPLLRE